MKFESALLPNLQISCLEADAKILREHKLVLSLLVSVVADIDGVRSAFPSLAVFHLAWWRNLLDV